MEKVVEYTVVTGSPLADFKEKVKQHLAEDWQPLGGVSFHSLPIPAPGGQVVQTTFSQAMVKYEK